MINPFYKIAIDRVNANYLSGWCFRRHRPEDPVHLNIRIDGQVVGATSADKLREDLRALNIHPTGRCGFEVAFHCNQNQGPAKIMEIIVPGERLPILRLSMTTFQPVGLIRIIKPIKSLLCRRNRKGPPILFMHVPKTAGTSFNTLASELLSRDGAVSHIELTDRRDYRKLLKRNRYISGHLPVGVWKSCFDLCDSDFFTIIREPYSQLHSHLKWLIETSTSNRDIYFKSQNPVIFRLGKRLSTMDFSSAEALASFVSGLTDIEAAFLDNMQTRYFLDIQPIRTAAEHYLQAQENSLLFREIGLTEQYDQFVETFLAFCNLKNPEHRVRLNRSSSRPLYDVSRDDNRNALFPLVRYDIKLYEFIRGQQQRG